MSWHFPLVFPRNYGKLSPQRSSFWSSPTGNTSDAVHCVVDGIFSLSKPTKSREWLKWIFYGHHPFCNCNISVYLGNRQFPFQSLSMFYWWNNKGSGFQPIGCDCLESAKILTGIREKKKIFLLHKMMFLSNLSSCEVWGTFITLGL